MAVVSVETSPGQVQGTDPQTNEISYSLSAFRWTAKLQRGRRHTAQKHNTGGEKAPRGSLAPLSAPEHVPCVELVDGICV